MPNSTLTHFDILEAKRAFAEGKNVTELLRSQKRLETNTSEIIETAYDLQAGTYIEYVTSNMAQASAYAEEIAAILCKYTTAAGSLLDVGTGELTTFSLVTRSLKTRPRNLFAFDISWSRIYKGLTFARAHMAESIHGLTAFVADMGEIPLRDKSISVTTSSHALEPNGGRLEALMAELFRVTRDKLVLFEPCYETNSPEGQQRMDQLGYIKGVDSIVERLGGTIVEKIPLRHVSNPLNPTVCFVIDPPPSGAAWSPSMSSMFSVPGTNYPLEALDEFYFSNATGFCYPVLKSIPILRSGTAILASALC